MSAPHESLLRRLFAGFGMKQIFDVGACSGTEGIRYASMFPSTELHAFEPVPANHSIVLENFRLHPELRAEAHCIALSDRTGTAVLNLSSAQGDMERNGHRSSSLLEPGRTTEVFPWLEFNERITVRTRTLDDFCTEHAIAAIDFIHMDVQGAELMVLRGSSLMLPRIRTIWMEVERIPLYLDQPVKKEVEAFMTENGFNLVISTVGPLAGDQFWVNRNFARQQPFSVRSVMFLRCREWRLRMALQNLRWRLGQALHGKLRAAMF